MKLIFIEMEIRSLFNKPHYFGNQMPTYCRWYQIDAQSTIGHMKCNTPAINGSIGIVYSFFMKAMEFNLISR